MSGRTERVIWSVAGIYPRCHSREGGNPGQRPASLRLPELLLLDSRLRGNDTAIFLCFRGIYPRSMPLHPRIADWFASKGWTPRPHQLAVLDSFERDAQALLIAPTGAGK